MKYLLLFILALPAFSADPVTETLSRDLDKLESAYLKKKHAIITTAIRGYEKQKVAATKAGNLEKALEFKAKISELTRLISPTEKQPMQIDYALAKHGASVTVTKGQVINNRKPELIIDGVTSDKENYTAVTIPAMMVVDLGEQRKAHKLNIHLWDYDSRTYSCRAEVSSNGRTWKVIGIRNHVSGMQSFNLKFSLRYVRVSGKGNSISNGFHVKEVEVIGP